jgi:hypothetical protein
MTEPTSHHGQSELVMPLVSGGIIHNSCGFSASSIDWSKLGSHVSLPFSDQSSSKLSTSAKSGSSQKSGGAQSTKSSGSAKPNKSSSQTSGSDYTSTISTLDSLIADTTAITAKLITYKLEGSDEKDTSSAELAALTNVGTLHLSSIYPSLVSTLFDSITFQDLLPSEPILRSVQSTGVALYGRSCHRQYLRHSTMCSCPSSRSTRRHCPSMLVWG